MTTFVSAFSVGACTVSVNQNGVSGPQLWSGALSFSQTSPSFDDRSSNALTVSVDANGVVSLNGTADPGLQYYVLITPTYSVGQNQIQSSDISFNTTSAQNAAYFGGDAVALTGMGSSPPYPMTPNPAVAPTPGDATWGLLGWGGA